MTRRFPAGILRQRAGRRLAAAALAAGAAVAVVACGGGSAGGSSSPLLVCVDAATTGANVANGEGVLHGAQAYAKYVNGKGGVLGRKLKIVVENDNSDPGQAADQVRKCVTQDGASFILGPELGSTAAGAIPVANQLKTVMIETGSGWTDIGISDSEQHGYAFPVVGDNYQAYALVMIKNVIVPQHLTRVGVIQTVGPATGRVGAYVQSVAGTYGLSVVSVQSAQPGSTNDAPEVTKLLAARPQAIVTGLTPGPDTLTALRAIRAQDPTIPIGLCTAACTAPSFISSAGVSTMAQVYLPGTADQLLQSLGSGGSAQEQAAVTDTKRYLAALKAIGYTSEDDVSNDYHGWDAAEELVQAIGQAGSVSESAVQHAMQHQSITVGGQFGFVVKRSPQHYDTVTDVIAAVAVVKPDGSLAIYKNA